MNPELIEKIIQDIDLITEHLLNKEVDCRPHATYMLGKLSSHLQFSLDCLNYEDDDD